MITPVKPKAFSGLSNLFNGFLAKKLNEIITAVNGGSSADFSSLQPVTTADATDAASAAALANANKAAINDIIAALKA